MEFLKSNRRFSFLYGGVPFWEQEMQAACIESENQVVQEYQLPDGLKVTNVGINYPAYGAYEWVTWLENTGPKPTQILSQLYDCDITLPFGHDDPPRPTAYMRSAADQAMVYAPSGSSGVAGEFYCAADSLASNRYVHHLLPGESREYRNHGGRSSDGHAPFFNVYRQNSGVIFAIGWSGQWNCQLEREENALRIRTKIEDTHFRLLPGEKIRTSSFVMMPYTGSYQESQNQWRRLVKEHFSLLGKSGRPAYAPFCAGIWGGMHSSTAIKRIQTMQKARLPYEYIWMDAGWYGDSQQDCIDEFEGDWADHTGDWRVNPYYHPDGLKEVSAAVHNAGMKFLLWMEPERVIYTTPIVSEHPEYFLGPPWANNANRLLNLGNEAAWQYCFALLCQKIEELGIDCYRQDFNFEPLEFWRLNDAADRQGITEIKHIMGLYRLWDSLLEKYPHLIIDNCASGGKRIDIETLRRSVPLWRSDAQCPANYPPELSQAHNMTFGTWLPYSGTGSGRQWGDVYRIRSAYAPGMTTNYAYSGQEPFGEEEAQLAWIRQFGAEYLKARPYFSADFYPLTDPVTGNDTWCAAQYNRPEEKDGMVQVFKRERSPYHQASFCLHGLLPHLQYEFTDADQPDASFVISGEDLLTHGLPVTIAQPRTAKLYFYRAVCTAQEKA